MLTYTMCRGHGARTSCLHAQPPTGPGHQWTQPSHSGTDRLVLLPTYSSSRAHMKMRLFTCRSRLSSSLPSSRPLSSFPQCCRSGAALEGRWSVHSSSGDEDTPRSKLCWSRASLFAIAALKGDPTFDSDPTNAGATNLLYPASPWYCALASWHGCSTTNLACTRPMHEFLTWRQKRHFASRLHCDEV
jgi:hypothetical protein